MKLHKDQKVQVQQKLVKHKRNTPFGECFLIQYIYMTYIRFIVSLLLPQLAGGIGALFTAPGENTWYQMLEKPIFNPPGWIFGPVWTILYICMGIAVFLVWNYAQKGKEKEKALLLFWVHLVFNASWSIVFFFLQSPEWAFINILIILVFIYHLIKKFFVLNKKAAYLLIPYMVWVSFATLLNLSIVLLN